MATDSNKSDKSGGPAKPAATVVDADLPAVVMENLNRPIRVTIHIDRPEMQLSDVIEAQNANAVVHKLKVRAMSGLPFRERLRLMRTSDVAFSQHLAARHNAIAGLDLPKPNSCEEFLRNWESKGLATIVPAD